jgi:hypothetical protein
MGAKVNPVDPPSVPRAWPGATVVCLATGPSLTAADVAYCRGKARVIAINDAYRLAPWADVLYAADARWWHWHAGVPGFAGAKWSLADPRWHARADRYPDVQRLRNTGSRGLERHPTGLRSGLNSGYQAINLAVHYGAARIVLLGYDLQTADGRSHFFGEHPKGPPPELHLFLPRFRSLVAPLADAGVAIVNCTRTTALECFPRTPLETALPANNRVETSVPC